MGPAARPLTAREAKALEPRKRAGPVAAWTSYLLFFLILGFVLWAFLFWVVVRFTHSISSSLVGASILAVPYILWATWELIRAVGRYRSYANDFRAYDELRARDRVAGVLEIRTYRITDAIEVEESDDEGSHYFLRLDDGSVLYLSGKYLYNSDEADEEDEKDEVKFPCTDFDLVVAPHSRVVFELVRRGSYLRPSKKLKPFRRERHQSTLVPKDLDLINIPWDEIEGQYSPKIARPKGKKRRRS